MYNSKATFYHKSLPLLHQKETLHRPLQLISFLTLLDSLLASIIKVNLLPLPHFVPRNLSTLSPSLPLLSLNVSSILYWSFHIMCTLDELVDHGFSCSPPSFSFVVIAIVFLWSSPSSKCFKTLYVNRLLKGFPHAPMLLCSILLCFINIITFDLYALLHHPQLMLFATFPLSYAWLLWYKSLLPRYIIWNCSSIWNYSRLKISLHPLCSIIWNRLPIK